VSGTPVFIGLGANLGGNLDVLAATLRQALNALSVLPDTRFVAVSSPYRSAPVDAGGPDYLNAVAAFETSLSPLDLLQALQVIERAHGRERPFPNAPRTLDLDLLLYGDRQIDSPELTVPHPRLQQRAFVLLPLLELDPALSAPGLGALSNHLPQVADQRITRLPEPL
jgi:2-amino-4-hydroxy-6-hydroxymethyldihydropteridine diphosphokinase